MKKYQAKDPQMTTFVFNDDEITTKLVYSLLAQVLSRIFGRGITVTPHPSIRQAVQINCDPSMQGIIQSFINKISMDWADSMRENHLRYCKRKALFPSDNAGSKASLWALNNEWDELKYIA